jgi:hypothetical protein
MPEQGAKPFKRVFSSRPSYGQLVEWSKEARETKETEKTPVKAQLEAFLEKQNTNSKRNN